MITLLRTPLGAIRMLVKDAFNGDQDLPIFHIVGGQIDKMIDDTVAKIEETSSLMPLQLFSINLNSENKTIGYLVISKKNKILYSFGINKKYRTKENLQVFFESIVLLMPNFKCYLWTKNSRAINFLIKNGMTATQENNYTILTYSIGE